MSVAQLTTLAQTKSTVAHSAFDKRASLLASAAASAGASDYRRQLAAAMIQLGASGSYEEYGASGGSVVQAVHVYGMQDDSSDPFAFEILDWDMTLAQASSAIDKALAPRYAIMDQAYNLIMRSIQTTSGTAWFPTFQTGIPTQQQDPSTVVAGGRPDLDVSFPSQSPGARGTRRDTGSAYQPDMQPSQAPGADGTTQPAPKKESGSWLPWIALGGIVLLFGAAGGLGGGGSAKKRYRPNPWPSSYARNPSGMKSLTFGVMPSFGEFKKHVTTYEDPIDPDLIPVFHMDLNRSDFAAFSRGGGINSGVHVKDGAGGKARVEHSDLRSLYESIKDLSDSVDEEAEMLASSMMYVVGYEWI